MSARYNVQTNAQYYNPQGAFTKCDDYPLIYIPNSNVAIRVSVWSIKNLHTIKFLGTCRPSHDRLWKRLPKNMGSTIMDHSCSALSGKLYDENLMVGLVISTLFSQR